MNYLLFKKAVAVSLAGHLAVFGVFNFSFGRKLANADYPNIAFFGAILKNADLMPSRQSHIKEALLKPDVSFLQKNKPDYNLAVDYYSKPATPLVFTSEKSGFTPKAPPLLMPQKRKEPVFTLHPQLPYHFLLYFQDRQAVHIELMVNILLENNRRSFVIKRKISSGNLEADLLTMRYISHYLAVQQSRLSPGNWQTVKIDLSASQ